MDEALLKEINELLALIGEGKPLITHVSGGFSTAFWQHGVPPDVRADVARAVYGVLEAKREAIRQENARRLLVDDARNFRAIIEFPPNDTFEISDGERTVRVSGELAVKMMQELKERAVAKLELTLESLVALDDEEGEDDGE